MSVKIDPEYLGRRLAATYKQFRAHPGRFGNATALVLDAGKLGEPTADLSVSAAMQVHLLNFEFPNTVMVMTPTQMLVLSGSKQNAVLQPALDALAGKSEEESLAMERASKIGLPVPVHLVESSKTDNKAAFARLIEAIKASGGKAGTLMSGPAPTGRLAPAWREALKAAEGVTEVDATGGLQWLLCVKDSEAVGYIVQAGKLSARMLTKVVVPRIMDIVDEERKETHAQMAEATTEALDAAITSKVGVPMEQADFAVPPVVQSGGVYEVRPGRAEADKRHFTPDLIVCSLGNSVMSYGSLVARTYFVDPTDAQKDAYNLLLGAHNKLIEGLRPGTKICDAVEAARAHVRASNPALADKLPKNFGSGVGLQTKERALLLSASNESVVKAGMCFAVSSSLHDVEHTTASSSKGAAMQKIKKYSLLIADTVAVTHESTVNATEKAKAEWTEVAFDMADDDEGEEEEEEDEGDDKAGDEADGGDGDAPAPRFRSQRLRDREASTGMTTNTERMAEITERQRMLHAQRNAEMIALLERGAAGAAGSKDAEDDEDVAELKTYARPRDLPRDAPAARLTVDRAKHALLVPVHGFLVPYNLNTIKGVSFSSEGVATLRINFYFPGQAYGRDAPKGIDKICGRHAENMFIKSMTFKSENARNLDNIFRIIKDAQKRGRDEARELEETKGIVEQGDLKLLKDSATPRLPQVLMKPVMSGKKSSGTLEAHRNGLRFRSDKGEKLDLIYSNIKHAIFQPCKNELIVLIHFSLKEPILVKKKKTFDIQFYSEVVDSAVAADARGGSMYDKDELVEEEREKQKRRRKNKAFREFCMQVEGIVEKYNAVFADGTFDVPSRDLGFQGVPNKEMVLLQPCTNCLVNLTESPFFVLSLDIIEHVHFERVSMRHKNFDLVCIFKEGKFMGRNPLPYHRISSIPMKDLDRIKEWLTDVVRITFTEGPAALEWKQIINDVARKPGFYEDGGWAELDMGLDEEEDGEEEESSYGEEEDDEEEEEYEESDDDSVELEDEDDLSEEEEEDDADEDSEDDWEAQEAAARAEDRRADHGDSAALAAGGTKKKSKHKDQGGRSKRSRRGD